MAITAIRGAITVEHNDAAEIENAAVRLLREIISRNNLSLSDIIFILFTCTADLDAAYPAAGLRKAGYTHMPMLCASEMSVKNSLEKCIRVLVLANANDGQEIRNVYLRDAKKLRPDLSEVFR